MKISGQIASINLSIEILTWINPLAACHHHFSCCKPPPTSNLPKSMSSCEKIFLSRKRSFNLICSTTVLAIILVAAIVKVRDDSGIHGRKAKWPLHQWCAQKRNSKRVCYVAGLVKTERTINTHRRVHPVPTHIWGFAVELVLQLPREQCLMSSQCGMPFCLPRIGRMRLFRTEPGRE